ncbi:MAG: hypothetical protein FWJ93_03050 [Micromonosporaceae bacterium]
MSQPEESGPKTSETDPVLMRPHQDPERRTAEIPPADNPGEVRVERDGELRPLRPDERAGS